MTIIGTIKVNILESGEKYIAHQCNCVTTGSAGLAKSIVERFPWADVYRHRKEPDSPGTIKIISSLNESSPIFICLFAQYVPGKSQSETRTEWFKMCLDSIPQEIESVAMPKFIGCGLAGGKWGDYEKILENSRLKITLYEL